LIVQVKSGTRRLWYRSLYWRIALGFVLFLAATLAAQAGLFLWLLSRSYDEIPGGSPAEFARLTSEQVTAALVRDPEASLPRVIASVDTRRGPPFFVLMRDGRLAGSTRNSPPRSLVRIARRRLEAESLAELRETDRRPEFRRLPGFAPIVLGGHVEGLVVVTPYRPLTAVLNELAPLMVVLAVALLAVGTTLAAVLIFGPARRRLADLEAATRALGAGDLSARAPETGGDEVSALARSFNQMAEELARRAEQLKQSDRMRRQLLADVSHELMTPLTAMRGYSETLAMADLSLDDSTRKRYFAIFLQETERLERIARDLLELARLEDGTRTQLTLQDVAIESLFGRVAARHEHTARERGVSLSTSIAPGAELVYGDPLRLEQALQNLAANALRHTEAGGRIELRAEPGRRGIVVITIRDTGEGIPLDHLPSIFDRFYKVDAARGAGSAGSGLGLSIVKTIVERHGGRIEVDSEVGVGTTFRLELPAAEQQAEHVRPSSTDAAVR
jgi:signal transduction histidine kinase